MTLTLISHHDSPHVEMGIEAESDAEARDLRNALLSVSVYDKPHTVIEAIKTLGYDVNLVGTTMTSVTYQLTKVAS